MGNKRNRAPRRKKQLSRLQNFHKSLCKKAKKVSTTNVANNIAAGEDGGIDVVDVVSDVKLEPIDTFDPIATAKTENGMENNASVSPFLTSDVKLEPTNTFNPIGMATENVTENGGSDGRTLLSSNQRSHELFYATSPKTGPQSEPKSNENVIDEEYNLIEFNNICRLCLTEDVSSWIEIFSSQPYGFGDEITPSNIVEVIEQFTTIKILEDDSLPSKLCIKCFQSLRFMYIFRTKSLRSQNSLNLDIRALSESLNTKIQQPNVLVDATQFHTNKRLVKVIRMKRVDRLNLKKAYHPDEDQENVDDFLCQICGNVFEKYKLLQHHLNIHNGVKPFVCTDPYCEKRFYTESNRKTHIKNVHSTNAPRFKCDLCEKSYNSKTKLKIHRTSHFPPTIPCTICGKLLRNQASVVKHRVCHTERLFKCIECGKSFQNSYTLRVHQRIHNNEKPFICCKCGQAFAYNCLLKTHTQKYHPD